MSEILRSNKNVDQNVSYVPKNQAILLKRMVEKQDGPIMTSRKIREKLQMGLIEAVADDCEGDFEVGQVICFARFADIELPGKHEFLLIRDEDVICVVNGIDLARYE